MIEPRRTKRPPVPMSRPERLGHTTPSATTNTVDGRRAVKMKATGDLMMLNRRIAEAMTDRGTVLVKVIETGEVRELWPIDCRQQIINGTVELIERNESA